MFRFFWPISRCFAFLNFLNRQFIKDWKLACSTLHRYFLTFTAKNSDFPAFSTVSAEVFEKCISSTLRYVSIFSTKTRYVSFFSTYNFKKKLESCLIDPTEICFVFLGQISTCFIFFDRQFIKVWKLVRSTPHRYVSNFLTKNWDNSALSTVWNDLFEIRVVKAFSTISTNVFRNFIFLTPHRYLSNFSAEIDMFCLS